MRRSRLSSVESSPLELIRAVEACNRPLERPSDLDPLLDRIGAARFVLLGEASHGTSEFYTWRAALSKRLIVEKGFRFLAVEGDWPDCYRINRYVKGMPDAGESADEVLHTLRRWPTWMWANEEIRDLMEWLRGYNDKQPDEKKVGFYGLDVYSLWDSLYAVMGYLRKKDPEAMAAALKAFRCFQPYGEDAQEYAYSTRFVDESCEKDVIDLLKRLRAAGPKYQDDGSESHFVAEQNALVLKNAEAYYRAMIRGGPGSWNIRDRHMAQTLDRLMGLHGPETRCVVWEHNTHIGDARFTDMADEGMVNVGQLVRERHEKEGVVLVGFGSYEGTVIAGKEWDAPAEVMETPPAREGSWENVLHQAEGGNKLLLSNAECNSPLFMEKRGHRAIGVVYHPEYEHFGNYVPTVLPKRYDAFLYLEETHALHPLDVQPESEHEEAPETYPSGI